MDAWPLLLKTIPLLHGPRVTCAGCILYEYSSNLNRSRWSSGVGDIVGAH